MRILNIISSSGFYGAEAMVIELCRKLQRAGHEVLAIWLVRDPAVESELTAACQSAGIESEFLRCSGPIDLGALSRLRSTIRSRHFEVLHSHGYKADAYASLAALRSKVTLVATCHNWLNEDSKSRLYATIDRVMLRRFDRIATVSRQVLDAVVGAGVAADSVCQVTNGIDFERFRNGKSVLRAELGIDSSAVLVGTVGRLTREKGIDTFLVAARDLSRRFEQIRFVIVGDGPERGALAGISAKLGLDDVLTFVGKRSDVADVYASLDIMVQPSLTEGLPLTVLEALASGTPVVATSVGAVGSIIEDGKHGFLIEPSDPSAIERAVSALVEDPALREQFAESGRKLVHERYSSERMAQDYEALYKSATRSV